MEVLTGLTGYSSIRAIPVRPVGVFYIWTPTDEYYGCGVDAFFGNGLSMFDRHFGRITSWAAQVRQHVGRSPMTSPDIALLVVDMQNDFLAKGGYYDRKSKPKSINTLNKPNRHGVFAARSNFPDGFVDKIEDCINEARNREWPIVFLQAIYGHEFGHKPWMLVREPNRTHYPCKRGTWGAELATPITELVAKNPNHRKDAALEITIEKHTFDGFCGTGIVPFLSRHKVRRILLVGIETHVCVLSTAISASCQGFAATMCRDRVATGRADLQEPALEIFSDAFGQVTTFKEFCAAA